MNKLYVIVRNDLEPGLQMAQTLHAGMEFAFTQPELTKEWFYGTNNVAVLQAPDELALQTLLSRASAADDVRVGIFHEPDLGGQLTAISMGGEGAERLVSNLPLALRP